MIFDLLSLPLIVLLHLVSQEHNVAEIVVHLLLLVAEVVHAELVLEVEVEPVTVDVLYLDVLDPLELIADHVDHEVVQDDEAEGDVDGPEDPDAELVRERDVLLRPVERPRPKLQHVLIRQALRCVLTRT